MGHILFLNSTCDIGENKRQGHATLSFLKIDMRHWGSPIKGPIGAPAAAGYRGFPGRSLCRRHNKPRCADGGVLSAITVWIIVLISGPRPYNLCNLRRAPPCSTPCTIVATGRRILSRYIALHALSSQGWIQDI